jgi:hypothetical protein
MKLVNDTNSNNISKPEIEQVQQEKQEYNILGTYLKSRGLKLFCYNPINGEIGELNIFRTDIVKLVEYKKEFYIKEMEHDKVQVDSRFYFFEALNLKTAQDRVNKWKKGTVKELCNLRKPGKISIF